MITLTTVEKFICEIIIFIAVAIGTIICEIIIFIAVAIGTIICGTVDASNCLLVGAAIWLACTIMLDTLVEVQDDEE